MFIEGQNFYDSPEGLINANIINQSTISLCDEMIAKYSQFGSALLMGYGDGELARYYATKFKRLHLVEGSAKLCIRAAETLRGFQNVDIHMLLFEEFLTEQGAEVDVVIGSHVLEHVENPESVINQGSRWLKTRGLAIFTVPNALSLHRRIGVRMKLLKSEYEFSGQDLALGHQRVFDLETFLAIFSKTHLKVLESGGYNLKILSQKQMKEWPSELLEAIYQVSRQCNANICSNLFVCCARA